MPIRVFNDSILNDMLSSAENDDANSSQMHKSMRSQHSGLTEIDQAAENMAERQRWRQQMREKQFQDRMEKLNRQVIRKIEEDKQRSEVQTQRMVAGFMKEHGTFVQECYAQVDHKEQSYEQKKKHQYNDWVTNVFDKIQAKVAKKVDRLDTAEIERQKRTMFQEFLDATNRKDGVYRDIIIESDYDPLAWRRDTLRYGTKKINDEDPVKRELTAMCNDSRGIGATDVGIPKARQKVTLDVKMWDKLEATPHGKASEMFSQAESGVVKPISKTQKSTMTLDHYQVDRDLNTSKHELHGYYGTKGRKVFEHANESFAID